MPEGPEVKRTKNYLIKFFKNYKINEVIILGGRYSRNEINGYQKFKSFLPIKCLNVKTKGKFIYFILENENYIFNTLGMSGFWTTRKLKHSNILYKTDKGNIYFTDQRNFGTFKFVFNKEELNKKLLSLGPDILSKNITFEDFFYQIKKKHLQEKKIAVVLLDQKVISGIGNYLRSEILWFSKISPHRLIKNLSDNEIKLLFKNSQKIAWSYYNITEALKLRIINKEDIKKINLYKDFYVYSQKKDPNGNSVINEKINDRTVFWVPSIQG